MKILKRILTKTFLNGTDETKEKSLVEKKKEYYVKAEDLINEIRKYQESKKNSKNGKGIISEELGLMIMKICTRFSMHPRFYGYTFRDDFVADAVCRCITHSIDRIDLSHPKCNPFSYITQTAYNVFRQRIKNEKKFQKARELYKEKYFDEFERTNGLKSSKKNEFDDQDDDSSKDYFNDYYNKEDDN